MLLQGIVAVANMRRHRNQLITMSFTQSFVTCLLALQWIGAYWYFMATQNQNKSPEAWVITYFTLGLTSNLYFLINAKSFHLSTLTSRLFRKTLITGLLKLLPGHLHRRFNAAEPAAPNRIGMNINREQRT
jgi:hypothetical protein